jgi:hypothetical protein
VIHCRRSNQIGCGLALFAPVHPPPPAGELAGYRGLTYSDPYGLCPTCENEATLKRDVEKVESFKTASAGEMAGHFLIGAAAIGSVTGIMGGTAALMRLAPYAGPTAAAASKIPFPEFQKWGQQAVGWGQNAAGALKAAAEMTAEKAATIDPTKVQAAKAFYENAVANGKGGAAAPERVKLMEKILELQM